MPGQEKSDLALRFLFLPSDALGGRPALVADDQVLLRRIGDHVVASCPPILSGRIEVRGSGIARAGAVTAKARLTIVADLDGSASTPRFPENDQWKSILGLPIRRIVLDPFEISAPIKLALALQNVLEGQGRLTARVPLKAYIRLERREDAAHNCCGGWACILLRNFNRQLSGKTMIGLIVVTHGNLAREFVAALEHVVGPQQQIKAISIFPNDDMEERRNAILEAAKSVSTGDGVIILTDMFGGTPSNLSISVMENGIHRSDSWGEPSDAGKACPHPGGGPAAGSIETGAGRRPKYIHVASLVLNAH